jgi:hypothetical protein
MLVICCGQLEIESSFENCEELKMVSGFMPMMYPLW